MKEWQNRDARIQVASASSSFVAESALMPSGSLRLQVRKPAMTIHTDDLGDDGTWDPTTMTCRPCVLQS
jgi:hypothetical protein